MQNERPKCLSERTVDFGVAVIVFKELKESRVWLLFASRFSPGAIVESLRSESRELLLMIGKSINTAMGRIKGRTIEA